MLQDRARIQVQAGAGGDGALSFRREAHVPRGGPDGGDGGRGGDVVLVCSEALRDLHRFRRPGTLSAGRGGHGRGALRHGARGEDLLVEVPPGTEAAAEDGARYDLLVPGQRAVVARGGSGGRGNKHFAGPTHQTPRFAERGLAGERRSVALRLRLLADVGLVGLPNAGKSSLLRRLTRAAPKVAGYPFTTLEPALGTLEAGERQLVLADIPGLIGGASEGAGLGHEFLAHVERTRLLVHVLDLAPLDGSEPGANHATIESELAAHDPRLAALPRMLVLSKADLVDAERARRVRAAWQERLGPGTPVLVTSAATGEGIGALAGELARRTPSAPVTSASPPGTEEMAEHRVFRPSAGRDFEVRRTGGGAFRVDGARVERLVARYDLDNPEAVAHLERRLRGIGVIRALAERGFRPGDDVRIAGVDFDLDPGAEV